MNQSSRNFSDADEKNLDFQPLPPGDYLAVATEISDEPTKKDPNARMYKITFEIARGDYAKRLLFAYWIYQHPTERARNIGRAMLRLFCEATTGKPEMNEALCINKPVTLRVDVEAGEKGPQNRIKKIAGPAGFPIPADQAAMKAVTGSPLDNIPFG